MTSVGRIGVGSEEKLITEYSLREGLAIYLDAWKRFFSTSVKSLVFVGSGVLVVAVASMFLTTAAVLGAATSVLSFFSSLIVEHPFLMLSGLVAFIFGLLVLRARRAAA